MSINKYLNNTKTFTYISSTPGLSYKSSSCDIIQTYLNIIILKTSRMTGQSSNIFFSKWITAKILVTDFIRLKKTLFFVHEICDSSVSVRARWDIIIYNLTALNSFFKRHKESYMFMQCIWLSIILIINHENISLPDRHLGNCYKQTKTCLPFACSVNNHYDNGY